jgi:excisionase family DNA binding protein
MHQDTDQVWPSGLPTTLPLADDQAAKALGISIQLIHQLIDEGELEAYRDEESELWLIESSSVQTYLKELRAELQGSDVSITTDVNGIQANYISDCECLLRLLDYNYLLMVMLMVIGTITLMAAVDTIATVLLSGG